MLLAVKVYTIVPSPHQSRRPPRYDERYTKSYSLACTLAYALVKAHYCTAAYLACDIR